MMKSGKTFSMHQMVSKMISFSIIELGMADSWAALKLA